MRIKNSFCKVRDSREILHAKFRKDKIKISKLIKVPKNQNLPAAIPKNGDSFIKSQYEKIKNGIFRLFSNILTANYGQGGKRIVLLDGCNVGYGHSNFNNRREFSIEGLNIALNSFKNNGFDVYAIMPKFRLKPGKSNDPHLLNQLYMNELVITTPCKEIPRYSMSYDDRFILDIAHVFNCAIVSNDQFRDLMGEKPEYAQIIERRIPFEWNGNIFIIPNGINNRNLYL